MQYLKFGLRYSNHTLTVSSSISAHTSLISHAFGGSVLNAGLIDLLDFDFVTNMPSRASVCFIN